MVEIEKRQIWFAIAASTVALILFFCYGFQDLAWIGLVLTLVGVLDFLFPNLAFEGWFASEAFGEVAEVWRFRSFVFMLGGPLLILYVICFP